MALLKGKPAVGWF